jgi:hypothetical protein
MFVYIYFCLNFLVYNNLIKCKKYNNFEKKKLFFELNIIICELNKKAKKLKACQPLLF